MAYTLYVEYKHQVLLARLAIAAVWKLFIGKAHKGIGVDLD